jgi:hypothetical protein
LGVDYSANFGLAIKVRLSDKLRADIFDNEYSENYTDGDIKGFLDYFLGESPYNDQLKCFTVGASNYTGGEDDYYIKLMIADENPFNRFLPKIASEVKEYLFKAGVVAEHSKFLIQGGIHIH